MRTNPAITRAVENQEVLRSRIALSWGLRLTKIKGFVNTVLLHPEFDAVVGYANVRCRSKEYPMLMIDLATWQGLSRCVRETNEPCFLIVAFPGADRYLQYDASLEAQVSIRETGAGPKVAGVAQNPELIVYIPMELFRKIEDKPVCVVGAP